MKAGGQNYMNYLICSCSDLFGMLRRKLDVCEKALTCNRPSARSSLTGVHAARRGIAREGVMETNYNKHTHTAFTP